MVDLEAFRSEYRGSWLPDDALWWREHPGTVGPSGRRDPSAAVRSLRDALYRPDATSADRDAFEQADRSVKEEQAEVDRAVAAAGHHLPGSPGPARGTEAIGEPARAEGTTRRRWLLALPLAGVLAAGVYATSGASHPVRASTPPAAVSSEPTTPPPPVLTAAFVSPIQLTAEEEAADEPLISKAFDPSSPQSAFSTIETGETAWATALGCDVIGGAAQSSATGAPIDFGARPVAGESGSTHFRFVVVLKSSDLAEVSVWGVPHGAGPTLRPALILQAQAAKSDVRISGTSFTTSRAADLRHVTVRTGARTPFHVEIEACQGR